MNSRILSAGLLLILLTALSLHGAVDNQTYAAVVASRPSVGDVVFTRLGGPVFARVAETSRSWTSHVGIIVDYRNGDWIVAESGVPFVRETPLRRFLGRSVDEQFAIMRLKLAPTDEQKRALLAYADAHLGTPYALGFDLHSRHTFCSKFVHDALYCATGQSIGTEESFDQLLHDNPNAPLGFWKAWFFGRIPWQRRTITPASELASPSLTPVVKNPA